MHAHICACACPMTGAWGSEGYFQESVLPSHMWVVGIRFGDNCLLPAEPSHLPRKPDFKIKDRSELYFLF